MADMAPVNMVYSSDPLTQLYMDHADIRREATEHKSEIRRDVSKEGSDLSKSIMDMGYRNLQGTDAVGDRLQSQVDKQMIALNNNLFDIARDNSKHAGEISAALAAMQAQIAASSRESSQASEISGLKMALELQKSQSAILDKINTDGDKTRELVNQLKVSDLERLILERSNELHSERHHAHHWRHGYDQAQFQTLANQMANFQSQLQTQGLYNFGNMAGVGQSSTSNSVR